MIGKSIRGILHYNEDKVAEGKAQLILASGFAGNIERMDIHQKYQRFKYLNDLRPTVKTNALHITLNFDASENIDNSRMQQIAMAYMEGIGFGEQPYLVYRHSDAGHQHVHIATTSIQRDGRPIGLNNIGADRSEPIRKQIEKDFGLIVAEEKTKFKQEPSIRPIDVQAVEYGKIPTKRAIGSVLNGVVRNYKYTSLPELNAILKQFNVIAERGQEDTAMFKNKGLIYFMLDKNCEKVGIPIKASSFYTKPTLPNIEKRYEKNREKRKEFRHGTMSRIDQVLNRYHKITKATLLGELQKRGIALEFRQNEKGLIYGTTFVDHWKKTVFNGSDLGKPYSAKAVSEYLADVDHRKTYLSPSKAQTYIRPVYEATQHLPNSTGTSFLEKLLGQNQDVGPALPKNRRKKKRKNNQQQQDQGLTL